MFRIKKFRKGRKIKSLADLLDRVSKHQYVYIRDRPCHPTWLMSMTVYTLQRFLRRGVLYVAKVIYEWAVANPHMILREKNELEILQERN